MRYAKGMLPGCQELKTFHGMRPGRLKNHRLSWAKKIMDALDFQIALQLRAKNIPFAALISAASMKADTRNLQALEEKFPDIVSITTERFNTTLSSTKSELKELGPKQTRDNYFRVRKLAAEYTA